METKVYPRIKNAVLLCLLWAGISVGLGLIDIWVVGLFGIGKESIIYGIMSIFEQFIPFGVVILIGFKKTNKKFNEVFKFNRVSFYIWLAIIVFMLGFVILSSELNNVLNYFLPIPQFLKDTLELMMVRPLFIISIIWVGIIPAFTEEMLFRGIMLNGFKENYSEKKAIIVSALLFGLIHLNPWQFLLAFIIGLFSAFIRLRTGSIVLSIYIHFFNNAMSVVTLKYKDIIPIKGINAANSKYSEKVFQPIWFDLIGLVIIVVGIILLRNGIKKLGEAKNGA